MGGTKTVAGFWLSHCFGKKELMADVLVELFALISSGALKPVIGATYGLSEAKIAHEAMLARQTTGKVTLDPRR
jgi:NADPH2:quinone reductase